VIKASLETLQAGREAMRQRCLDIADKYIRLVGMIDEKKVAFEVRKSLTGRAAIRNGRRVIQGPNPVTRRALYIVLHECAHHLLRHQGSSKPKHLRELEAELWAHNTMREEGLEVPSQETERAKAYVAWKIKQALKRGAKNIHPEAVKWSGFKLQK
jgi:hypothetical protein